MDGTHGIPATGRWRVGAEPGGTFTDVCLFDAPSGRIAVSKVSLPPEDPARGIAQGVAEGMTKHGGGAVSDPAGSRCAARRGVLAAPERGLGRRALPEGQVAEPREPALWLPVPHLLSDRRDGLRPGRTAARSRGRRLEHALRQAPTDQKVPA